MDLFSKLLLEYKKADFEKRLNLYLECPALREKFIEIDQNEQTLYFSKYNVETVG